VLFLPSKARADECGGRNPSYIAVRAVTFGGSTVSVTVYVSNNRIREEADLQGRRQVTIRDPDRRLFVTFDPDIKRGLALPPPPRQSDRRTRVLEEAGPNGTRIRRFEFQEGQDWIELSRTTCRLDGIMVQQSFVSIGHTGQVVRGTISQEQIRVGPVPSSAFEVPSDVELSAR
jgi:hypothetical protein